MVHIASPMLLEGRGSSRAGSVQMQPDVSCHSSLSMRSRSELNSSPMMVQAQSPHRSARESQQIQNYLMAQGIPTERSSQPMMRNQYQEVPSTTPSHMSHTNIMQRSAIAQQLVQQSLNNSKAQYQMMNQNINNQNQIINQQGTRSQGQYISQGQHINQGHQSLQSSLARPSSNASMSQITSSAYNSSQTLPRNNAPIIPISQNGIQNQFAYQTSAPISQSNVQNQFSHQTLPSRNSPQMLQRLTQNTASSQQNSRKVPYSEQISSQQQKP